MAAEAEAKAVVHDVRLRPADPIGVPAISVQDRPTVVFIKGAMVCVRTALGDEHDVCPAPQAEWAAGVIGLHVELLDAFHWRRNGAFRAPAEGLPVIGVSRSRVGDFPPIRQKRIVVAARTGYLAAEAAGLRRGSGW